MVCVYKTDRKTKHVICAPCNQTFKHHAQSRLSKHTELYEIAIEKDFGKNNSYVSSFWLQVQRVHWHTAILLQLTARDNMIMCTITHIDKYRKQSHAISSTHSILYGQQ